MASHSTACGPLKRDVIAHRTLAVMKDHGIAGFRMTHDPTAGFGSRGWA